MSMLAILATTGLLLVKSEPVGANIVIEGVSCGETPRLITHLSTNHQHKIVLRKAGYMASEFKVRFDGRKPMVVNERLVLDSGVVNVKSEPQGALVIVNGVERGRTPVSLTDIPKGRTTVKLRLDGYKDVSEGITIKAGDVLSLNYTLEGLPGTLALSSVPAGARFYVNGEPRGQGPLVLADVKPGVYEVRAELEGFLPETRKVGMDNGTARSEEFRLVGNMGSLEVRSSPAGAQIVLDGRNVGITQPYSEDSEFSRYLHIPNVADGEHTLVIRREGYGEVTRHPLIKSGRVSKANVRLKRVFVPNVELETATGNFRGILVKNEPDYVVIEVSLGIERSFPRSDIKKIAYLGK